jgi:hypothetical protein
MVMVEHANKGNLMNIKEHFYFIILINLTNW